LIITTGASTPRRRPALRIGLVAVLTALAAVGFAGPAAAHDVLISSDPADGSTLQTAPATVTLTFDQPVQEFEPVVTMTGPDGQSYQSGSPTVDSTVVTNTVGPLTVAGEYVIAYRVVSADGHPVTGEVKFQFAGAALAVESAGAGSAATGTSAAAPTSGTAATSAATPTSAAVSTVAVAPASSSSGLSGWVWAALALVAVLIIAAVVVVLRRPRQSG
jgi:methionine-rich copper-binding protein CopC